MGILTHRDEMQTEPQVVLGDESGEWSPALEPVLHQPRAALGQSRTLSRLDFSQLKWQMGALKWENIILG